MPATLDASTLRDAMTRYVEALRRHREEIDSLNVFPVPDGDTGTNLLLTQEAVAEALRGLDGGTLADLAEAISHAALLGARGNSGVILSQVLRGMCSRLREVETPGAEDLAAALAEAADEARRAVADPVEGTMLSVIRDAAEGARETLAEGRSCQEVAEAALAASATSLERTRQQLPALASAGVVDAGGKGVVLLLDALVAAIRGDAGLVTVLGPMGPVGAPAPADGRDATEGTHGYEVMFLLEAGDEAVGPLRRRLEAIGDSLVVVGGAGLFNVHVHTPDPGAAVEAGVEAGRPRQIRITDLTAQVEACIAGEARGVRVSPTEGGGSLLAVAHGGGFTAMFRSLGASVVPGGPGAFPSVAELARAIEQAPPGPVVLLANHPDVLPAAEAAAGRASREVRIVPTGSMAQGIAAAASWSPEDGRAAAGALARSASGALARTAAGGGLAPGGWVALAHGGSDAEVMSGADPASAAVELVSALSAGRSFELCSVYAGEGADEADTRRIEEGLRAAFPELELEVHDGGQPHHPYLIGLE